MDFDLSLHRPWLALLLLAVPAFWWWSRNAALPQRLLRSALLLALAAAALQPQLLHHRAPAAQLWLVDQAPALDAAQRRAAEQTLRHRLAAARDGQGADAVLVLQRGGPALDLGLPLARQRVLDGATSWPDAVRQALALLPPEPGARLGVIAEDRAIDDLDPALRQALVQRGVVLEPVTLAPAPRPWAIAAVSAAPVQAGEAVALQVELDGSGPAQALEVWRGETLLARGAASADDAPRVLALPGQAAGFVPLRLRLVPAGTEREFTLAVQNAPRVLALRGLRTGGAAAWQALLGARFAVDEADPQALATRPDLAATLTRYDAVLLDDVPAAQLPAPLQQALLQAVNANGLGLLVSGGEAVFGNAALVQAPLGAALPVRWRPQQRSEQPTAAVALVIDTSGSMRGRPLALAQQVARLAARGLDADDTVGVVEFYGGRQWVAPLQPARHTAEVERAIGRVRAQGATVLYPALEEAYYGLKGVEARHKHIVVLSDAGVAEDRYQPLLRQIAQDRISVSTVLVGGDPEGEARMALWARLGQGRFYLVRDEFSLVQLDFKPPQRQPQPGFEYQPLAPDAASQPPWLAALEARLPTLDGHARVQLRPEAQPWLMGAGGEPLLASWQVGAGRVSALMTEPLGAGTATWRLWPAYGAWLGRVLARTAAAREWPALQAQPQAGQLQLLLQLPADDGRPELQVVGQEGPAPALQAVAPGRYAATLSAAADRETRLLLQAGARSHRFVVPATAGPAALPAHRPVLRWDELAHAGGAPAAAGGAPGAIDLSPGLLLLALALYLAELLWRRWPQGSST